MPEIEDKPKLTKEEKAAKKAAKLARTSSGGDEEESPKKKAKKDKKEGKKEEAAVEDVEATAEEEEVVAEPTASKLELEEGDEALVCRDCGEEFIFTAGEAAFFESKGFTNKKTRCAACTAAKKERFGESGGGKGGKGKGKGKGKGDGGKGGGGGVCYAFQRGECNRGDSCRFSH